MTWREFEALVGEAYRRQGWRAAETDSGPDGGVDLVLRRDRERLFVQCKHWRAQRVGVKVVRELKGVIAQAGATGGVVVTSGGFTQEAVAFAQAAGITLLDGVELQRLAREVRHHHRQRATRIEPAIPDAASEGPDEATPACPQCGAAMLLREAKRGPNAGRHFWGCKEFPKCRGTRPLVEKRTNVERLEKSPAS